eukprot:Opistho-2@30285
MDVVLDTPGLPGSELRDELLAPRATTGGRYPTIGAAGLPVGFGATGARVRTPVDAVADADDTRDEFDGAGDTGRSADVLCDASFVLGAFPLSTDDRTEGRRPDGDGAIADADEAADGTPPLFASRLLEDPRLPLATFAIASSRDVRLRVGFA